MRAIQPTTNVQRPAQGAAAARAPRTLHHACRPLPQRRLLGRTRAQAEYKELLSTLQSLSDPELAAWAAQHRERLSLPFLGWLSEEELAASSDEPDHQQQLWELGSKLMALREGLSPVGNEVLQAELRAAALRCSSGSGGAGGGDGSDEEEEAEGGQHQRQRRQNTQQPPAAAAAAASTALATPAFSSAVSAAAALGLSPEGMSLFQQQAAALEAVVGTSRATSLTEVIGRAKVQDQRQLKGLAESDAAVRILDVLLSVQEREERAAMLSDAFTPPGSTAAVDDDADYFSPGEDQVSTTPLRLLQAIDLYLARLQGGGSTAGPARAGRQPAALMGGRQGLSLGQLEAVLWELREDVEGAWASSDGETC